MGEQESSSGKASWKTPLGLGPMLDKKRYGVWRNAEVDASVRDLYRLSHISKSVEFVRHALIDFVI